MTQPIYPIIRPQLHIVIHCLWEHVLSDSKSSILKPINQKIQFCPYSEAFVRLREERNMFKTSENMAINPSMAAVYAVKCGIE